MDWLSLDKATCENCFYSDNGGKCALQLAEKNQTKTIACIGHQTNSIKDHIVNKKTL